MTKKRSEKKSDQRIYICIPVFSAVMIVLLLWAFPPVSAQPKGKDGDVLTVGVPTDRCPVFYLDRDTNEIAGIGVDLMRIAAKEAGYQVTFKALKEETLKDALDNKTYDVVLPFGSAVSSTSGKPTVVSDNLFQTPFTLVTVNNRDLPDLNELHVGMLHSLAGGAETVRQLYPGIDITFYDTMDESVKALRKGKEDALLHNSYVWSYVLQKPSYCDLTVQPATMFSMDFRVGALDTPEGRMIIDRLNNGIARLSDTGRQAVALDYTSRRLYRYDASDYLYQYGLVLFLLALLFILLVVVFVLMWRSHRFKQEEKLRQMIEHDSLTGALSLRGFRKRAAQLLREHPDVPYVLSYNNIKNFKYINDSLGMEAGDELLRFWADLSMDNLTELDAIGRLEADHFAVLHHLEDDEHLAFDVKTVFNAVRNYFIKRNNEIRVQICTGVYVLTPEDYQHIDIDHMLDFARVAEKRVRDSHKEGFGFYNPEQWKAGQLMADVTSRLPLAIEAGEIQVWYQPQVDYEKGRINGAEALCRWNHAARGWISPAEFIPALEESGQIYELDCFVWERVCKDLQRWNGQGERRSISVNLSRTDIVKNQNISEHFQKLIGEYGLTPEQLRIEITETAYVENPDLLISTTHKLRECGFQVEMDDFGSGYSSLNMLKEVQVDRIKLDLRFLTETGNQEKGRIIVKHMIQMAHSLGMGLIAEGVETEEQAEFLRSLDCLEMQGYYFHKPMPASEFERILK